MCIFFFLCQKWRLKFFKIWLTKCLINVIQGVIFLLWYSFSLCIDWYSHRECGLDQQRSWDYTSNDATASMDKPSTYGPRILCSRTLRFCLLLQKYWWYIQYIIKFKNPIPNVNHLGHTKNKFSKTCTLYK